MNASKIINDNFLHHASFLQSRTPGMTTVQEKGFCYSDSGLSCDTFNILYITDGNNFDTPAFERAIQHYQSKHFKYCIWINEENLSPTVTAALQNAGLQEAGNDPGMLIELKNYKDAHGMPIGLTNYNGAPGMPIEQKDYNQTSGSGNANNYSAKFTNINIRKLTTASMLQDFAQLVSCNWTPPDQNVIEFYSKVSPIIFAQNNIEYFGSYIDENLVSAIELFPDSNTNAGLYSLCTLDAFRGKGIATALMKHCLGHLRSKGYTTATLQASDDGLRIYQRLGFVQTTRFREFKALA
jgi:GNAT superfamily N-acetyltransferase